MACVILINWLMVPMATWVASLAETSKTLALTTKTMASRLTSRSNRIRATMTINNQMMMSYSNKIQTCKLNKMKVKSMKREKKKLCKNISTLNCNSNRPSSSPLTLRRNTRTTKAWVLISLTKTPMSSKTTTSQLKARTRACCRKMGGKTRWRSMKTLKKAKQRTSNTTIMEASREYSQSRSFPYKTSVSTHAIQRTFPV